MKAKFAKLLLGEDMSGGGKGVSSALALSNSITNLAGISLFIIRDFNFFNFSTREYMSKLIELYSNNENFAASTFGEQKLESLSPGKRTRWNREIEWFLSVTDHIVEFVPSKQSKDGIDMEVLYLSLKLFFLLV